MHGQQNIKITQSCLLGVT